MGFRGALGGLESGDCGDSAGETVEGNRGKGEKKARCRLSKVRAPIGRVNFRPH